jgi:hypothetical protein
VRPELSAEQVRRGGSAAPCKIVKAGLARERSLEWQSSRRTPAIGAIVASPKRSRGLARGCVKAIARAAAVKRPSVLPSRGHATGARVLGLTRRHPVVRAHLSPHRRIVMIGERAPARRARKFAGSWSRVVGRHDFCNFRRDPDGPRTDPRHHHASIPGDNRAARRRGIRVPSF